MSESNPAHSWFGPPSTGTTAQEPEEYDRLWLAFMAARVALGLVLVVLQMALCRFLLLAVLFHILIYGQTQRIKPLQLQHL